jgi:hypothetical protein
MNNDDKEISRPRAVHHPIWGRGEIIRQNGDDVLVLYPRRLSPMWQGVEHLVFLDETE